MSHFYNQFMLRNDITFLNHGSFGASPKYVFDTYQLWQRELEAQPVAFMQRTHDALLEQIRDTVGKYIHANMEDLILVPNATIGINMVAQGLHFDVNDEILMSNQEYGAMEIMWQRICEKTGAKVIQADIPLNTPSPEEWVQLFWQSVSPQTKVIFLSHISSPTALILPVEGICKKAREAGILCIIDGAHVPGHLTLDIEKIGADAYIGNFHKWLCAPKGSAFVYVHPDMQDLIHPLIYSWGDVEGASFNKRYQWIGTRDFSAILSVPAAIQYQNENDWASVFKLCHDMASEMNERICDMTGLAPLMHDDSWYGQMVSIPLPDCDAVAVQTQLIDQYHIEVPLITWNNQQLMRVSFQAYNHFSDLEQLSSAISEIFKLN
ncbi:aminotransferase class V-fold PLP-dependent enzyme [Anaerolineales bacterium]